MEIRYINLDDIKGSFTGKSYNGKVQIKLFLTLQDRIKAQQFLKNIPNIKDIDKESELYQIIESLSLILAHIIIDKDTPAFLLPENILALEDIDPSMFILNEIKSLQYDFINEKKA